MSIPNAKAYKGFADLEKHQIRNKDFRIVVVSRPGSRVAIIAPHGGLIERRTSEIATAIAGDSFNLYLFEGIRGSKNYTALHLTSHLFDEPECMNLIGQCSHVVAIHGCQGDEPKILLGGLDQSLKIQLAKAFSSANLVAELNGHNFPATESTNICNRGLKRQGVQIELSAALRGSDQERLVVSRTRDVLIGLDAKPTV